MKYYYDIYLNYYKYPLMYYEWNKEDNIKRVLKIAVIRLNSIKDLILYNATIDTDLNEMIITDGFSAVAIKLVDKEVKLLSYLPLDDELSILELASTLDIVSFDIKYYQKRYIPNIMRIDDNIRTNFLKYIKKLDIDTLKYIYYEITGNINNNINYLKEFLSKDIKNNFNEKYIHLYYQTCKLT